MDRCGGFEGGDDGRSEEVEVVHALAVEGRYQ